MLIAAALLQTACGGGKKAESTTPGHAAPELEQKLPAGLAGTRLKLESYGGPTWARLLPTFNLPPEMDVNIPRFLRSLGKKPKDLQFAWAISQEDGYIKISAYQVEGVGAGELLPAYVDSLRNVTTRESTISGKRVLVASAAGSADHAYLHAADGALFITHSIDVTNTELRELIAAEP